MKKIITNTILKKFIWTILLVMLVFQFCFPSLVWAIIEEDAEGNYTYFSGDYVSDLYTSWIDKIEGQKNKDTFKSLVLLFIQGNHFLNYTNADSNAGLVFDDRQESLVVMARIIGTDPLEFEIAGVWDKEEEYLFDDGDNDPNNDIPWDATWSGWGDNDWEKHQQSFIEKYILQGKYNTKEEENGTIIRSEIYKFPDFKTWLGYEYSEQVYPLIEEKFKEFIKSGVAEDNGLDIDDMDDNTLNDLAKFIFEKYKDATYGIYIAITVEGPENANNRVENTNYEITNVVIESQGNNYKLIELPNDFKEYEDSIGVADADMGGFLLSLLLPFVNFIADTALNILGNFMVGEDGIENVDEEDIKPTNIENITIDQIAKADMRSFDGDLLSLAAGIFGGDTTQFFVTNYSPETIFAGEVELLSIDFISGGKTVKTDPSGNVITDINGNAIYEYNSNNGWNTIRQVIAEWYKALRMIAIIGLLSVLIYTGIKIIISSNAKDKAKFKEWIINWFIAVAILFFMHYIMSFIISVTGGISDLISESCKDLVVEKCEDAASVHASTTFNPDKLFVTDLMGYVRFNIQSDDLITKVGYEVIYIALIVYTFKFTFIYLKRVLNMAFLTLIAPIVALTYPIDKMNDGSAQGFQMWIKEYIFNALLQPMHYILYYILLSSAIGLAAKNPLYAIVCLMFMTEAEKLLKKIFGFEKAGQGTVGGLGAGAFAAGALASNVKNLARMAGKLGGGNGGNSGDDKNPLNNPKPTQSNDFSEFDDPQSDQQQLDEGKDEQPQEEQQQEQQQQQQSALDKYSAEGFGQNANGEYYNPWTDEYDPDYNPEDDPAYANAKADEDAQKPDLENERRVLDEFFEEGALSDTWTDEDYAAYDELERELKEKEEKARLEQAAQPQPEPPPADTGTPVREMAEQRNAQLEEKKKESKFKKGVGAVWKKLHKPIWDSDKSRSYNFKRLARGGAKLAIGAAVGITAAAVQAGISITDGKYSIGEGLATFGAGFAGGSAMVDGLGGMVRTYQDGASAGDKQKQMERAQARYADRDDVIAFNQREYPSDPKAAMERQRDHYLPNGVTDLKEMKSCMKYANTLTAGGMSQEDADRRAAKVANFKKQLKDQGQAGAIYDKKKQQAYIDEMVKQAAPEEQAKLRGRYQNLFNAAQAFDKAQQ